jgi:histidinol-phosphatase
VFEQELSFAQEMADAADAVSLEVFRGSFEVRQKPDRTPVTEADLRVEELIRERLASRFPRDAVLGEEHGGEGDAERRWVIDPVDGTKNFAAGIQIWGTLIALMVGGEPVLGVASLPALGERYAAARGGGASLNGTPIRVSPLSELSDALVVAGTFAWSSPARAEAFVRLGGEAARTRAFGDCWSHLLVARGSAHVMVEEELRTWDWAAPAAIVREAGGRVTQLDGSPLADRGSVLTTNGALHDQVLRLLGEPSERGGAQDEGPGVSP